LLDIATVGADKAL